MQKIIVEKPYQFIPPYRGTFWPWVFRAIHLHVYYLGARRACGSMRFAIWSGFRESLAAGHAILLTPNHPRTADPLAMGWLAVEAPCHFHVMASWHLFHHSRLYRWAIRAMGGFSVNREGVDRQAINMAIDLLAEAKRPLVIFPEGSDQPHGRQPAGDARRRGLHRPGRGQEAGQALAARQGRRPSDRGQLFLQRRHPRGRRRRADRHRAAPHLARRSASCPCRSESSRSARPC